MIIKAEGLKKTFRVGFRRKEIEALKGLDLEIEKGEIFGFLGPNGAGKTTTIKILVGLIKPSAGKAWVMNQPVGTVSAREKLGFLPEQPYFYDYLTGEEFLNFCSRFFPFTEQERKKRINHLLELVGLERARDLALRKYSKGMLQRIGLAQALINDPELVILDEPLTGLDPIGRKEMRDLISQLGKENKTVFFSTHILSDVEVICDRVGIIHQGKLLGVGLLEDLYKKTIKEWELQAEVRNEQLLARLNQLSEEKNLPMLWQKERVLIRTADEEEAQSLLKLIFEGGGKILEYTVKRESLEDFFWKVVEKEDRQ